PGAVRASAGLSTGVCDLDRLLAAVRHVVSSDPPVPYELDPATGDYRPEGHDRPSGRSGACGPG
ncbi:MAG TPA: hypothetical protein VLV15_16765, partial [Dongiaceae bacterium]|nr:hypothetical protein [Dongiaceae bacterium]